MKLGNSKDIPELYKILKESMQLCSNLHLPGRLAHLTASCLRNFRDAVSLAVTHVGDGFLVMQLSVSYLCFCKEPLTFAL